MACNATSPTGWKAELLPSTFRRIYLPSAGNRKTRKNLKHLTRVPSWKQSGQASDVLLTMKVFAFC
jgi:hypothetical protein